ncbi:MAG: hypothetical protein N3A61_02545 [Ignavibacteria bacterium]|nr:hypothetical protein [Ignavibacteria bacterium]
MKQKFNFILFILIIISSNQAFSQRISGRLTSFLYTWSRYDSLGGEATTHARHYESMQLGIVKNNFSINTYLQYSNDYGSKMLDDPEFKFYNLYIDWKNIANLADVRIGRQFIYGGLGAGTIDGLNLKLYPIKNHSLQIYYGALIPPYKDLSFFKSIKDNYLYGARLNSSIVPNTQININWMKRNRKPEDFLATRPDSAFNPIKVPISISSIPEHYLNFDVSYDFSNSSYAYGRIDYDFNFEKVSRGEFNIRYNITKSLGANAGFTYREPRVLKNSIFSVFDISNSKEVEAGIDYKFTSDLTAYGKFGLIQYKDDNSSRIGLGLNTKYGSISYLKNFGYAGELDALSLYLFYALFENKLFVNGGASYSNYKLDKNQSESYTNLSSMIGLNYKPFIYLSFDVQLQYITNRFYKNDVRSLIKINYMFSELLGLL